MRGFGFGRPRARREDDRTSYCRRDNILVTSCPLIEDRIDACRFGGECVLYASRQDQPSTSASGEAERRRSA